MNPDASNITRRDMAEHRKTYEIFLRIVKGSIIASVVFLVLYGIFVVF